MAITLDGTNGVTTPASTNSGNESITGNATVGGTLGVTGTTTIGNGTSGVAKINGGSSSSGQIIFMDAGTNRARIGVPTGTTTLSLSGSNSLTGDVVIDVDGRVTMPNQPAFMAYKNGNQSLTAHTLTKITGWTEAVDQSNEWDNANARFTATSAGIYLFGILMQPSVVGGTHLQITKNGNNGVYGDNYLDGSDVGGMSYTLLMPMSANDYVEYNAYLTLNGNINANRSKVWAVKVG